jgi:hypothetical protein
MLVNAASRDITPQQTDGLHLAGFGAGRTAEALPRRATSICVVSLAVSESGPVH